VSVTNAQTKRDATRTKASKWQVAALSAYVVIDVLGIVAAVAATSSKAWERGGGIALVVTAIPLIGLLMARRWAWIMCVVFTALSIVLTLAHGDPRPSWVVLEVLPLALLLSPPIRRYVRSGSRTATDEAG
jgi:hypothetical protein